jgi:pyruvate dehydrogenase E2 component (dihydrolipoamide acetyltransferase)
MAIELKMPALSPTMEEGTLARWLVKEGDSVSSGDLLAEIETDKATMEFEAVDEGVVMQLLVAEGTDGVKVGTVIALIQGEDEDAAPAKAAPPPPVAAEAPAPVPAVAPAPVAAAKSGGERVIASPLAKRIAADRGVDLPSVAGSGPNGRIVKADVEAAAGGAVAPLAGGAEALVSPLAKKMAEQLGVDISTVKGTGPNGRIVKADIEAAASGAAPKTVSAELVEARPAAGSRPSTGSGLTVDSGGIPHEIIKLSNMRKTIARRLTESKQQVPHIYLTVDVRLDALLKLRSELNASLEARGVKLSVNDMLIKALGLALVMVPKCNVSFAGDTMLQYSRADISVAVSIPNGLITPIITDAGGKSISTVSTEMAALAAKAKDGKLQPHEFQGGTASLSNMGMMGIKQFEAVINPPQGMSSTTRWRLRP